MTECAALLHSPGQATSRTFCPGGVRNAIAFTTAMASAYAQTYLT